MKRPCPSDLDEEFFFRYNLFIAHWIIICASSTRENFFPVDDPFIRSQHTERGGKRKGVSWIQSGIQATGSVRVPLTFIVSDAHPQKDSSTLHPGWDA